MFRDEQTLVRGQPGPVVALPGIQPNKLPKIRIAGAHELQRDGGSETLLGISHPGDMEIKLLALLSGRSLDMENQIIS